MTTEAKNRKPDKSCKLFTPEGLGCAFCIGEKCYHRKSQHKNQKPPFVESYCKKVPIAHHEEVDKS